MFPKAPGHCMYLQPLSVEVSQTLQTHLLWPMMTAYQVFFFFFLWVVRLWLTDRRELPHSLGVQAHPKAAAPSQLPSNSSGCQGGPDRGCIPSVLICSQCVEETGLVWEREDRITFLTSTFPGQELPLSTSPCDLPRSEARTSL